MMGASVLAPTEEILLLRSFEYKHKPRRLGAKEGCFTRAVYPVGEFSYVDMQAAYAAGMTDENGLSKLTCYSQNTYFCPSMSNLDSEKEKTVRVFDSFSESTARYGATLAPLLCKEWERLGGSSLYAHIAKGGIPIHYYFTEEMIAEYNRRIGDHNQRNSTAYPALKPKKESRAAEYFAEKCRDLFEDAEKRFPTDDMSNKCFFWLQGEEEWKNDVIEYETKLKILWESLKQLGFTHFFCIRVDYFGNPGIHRVMRAQENFTKAERDAFMLTRAASYLTFPGQTEDGWFKVSPGEEYRECRDSFFGFNNNHINEKGFKLIAERAAKNLFRVLVEGKEPIPEGENIIPLTGEKAAQRGVR